MARSNGEHHHTPVMTSDDPDALEIDIDGLPQCNGMLLHFYELLPGDLFKIELLNSPWPDDASMVMGPLMVYLGSGSYTQAALNDGGWIFSGDPSSGRLVEVVSLVERPGHPTHDLPTMQHVGSTDG